MGNRAVITTKRNFENNGVGIYLHWNGGRDSVEAFLTYAKLRGFRPPDQDSYGWARLCQVIGNFFGGGLSLGIDTVDKLDCDNYDNGTYIIEGWEIVGRKYFDGCREQDSYDLDGMLEAIDESQPPSCRLGEDFLHAVEKPISEIKVGDVVFLTDGDGGRPERHTVVGIGTDDGPIRGLRRAGLPYVDAYGEPGSWAINYNNYLKPGMTYRVSVSAETEEADPEDADSFETLDFNGFLS